MIYFVVARIINLIALGVGVALLVRGLISRRRTGESNRGEAMLFSIQMILWALALRIFGEFTNTLWGWLTWS